MKKQELDQAWAELKAIHAEYLEEYGVKLPTDGNLRQMQLAILYAVYKQDPEKLINKNEMAKIIMEHFPDAATDQQIRHLKRDGWRLTSEKSGWHRLDPYRPSPEIAKDAIRTAKVMAAKDFDGIKEAYNYICASCGVEEGQPSWRYGDDPIKLEAGHPGPEKPSAICICHRQHHPSVPVLPQGLQERLYL